MDNKTIAKYLSLTADLMELHGENPFKIKSYDYAGRYLKNMEAHLSAMSLSEIEKIQGIGKNIAAKIVQLCTVGSFDELDTLLSKTPSGIVELFQLKGIGPKKIAQLWKELNIESIGELEYACHENRLVTLKGFGVKTQENILQQIQFISQSAHFFLWCNLEELAIELIEALQSAYPTSSISTCGDFRRKKIILECIDILMTEENIQTKQAIQQKYSAYPVRFHFCKPREFYWNLLQLSSEPEHSGFLSYKIDASKTYTSENEIYEAAGLPFIVPEIRDAKFEFKLIEQNKLADLIEQKDIKGIVHAHSHYSDGANSLKELALYCKQQGFEYLVISDHSKSAFYANGMSIETILQQHEEIEKLNMDLFPFKIFKSIESDILYDGSLDYEDDILKTFDLVIASVHAQLKMNEERAMMRLIKAIENPYTTILGHLTGRLLLSRAAYPVNHKKIIGACAANQVSIELNANPRRLDIDYQWIEYCQEKNVLISINPDAHQLSGIHDIKYGVYAARKGGLLKANTLNTLTKDNFVKYLSANRKV